MAAKVLTAKEVARRLRLDRTTIYAMFRSGQLTGFKTSKRKWGMLETDLDRYITQQMLVIAGESA